MSGLFKYWGRSPMPVTRYESNNYYMPPMMHHCCGGGNSIFNVMGMLGIMSNLFRPQTPQIYPMTYPSQYIPGGYPGAYSNMGLQLGNNQSYIDPYQQQADMNDLALCNNLFGTEYYIAAQPLSNGTYVARNKKTGAIVEANSPSDLYEQLKARTSDGSGSVEDSNGTKTGETGKADESGEAGETGKANDGAADKDATTKGTGTATQELTTALAGKGGGYNEQKGSWKMNGLKTSVREGITANTTVNHFLDGYLCGPKHEELNSLSLDMYKKLKDDVITNNPSCFNKDGTVKLTNGKFAWNRLELPSLTTLEKVYGLKKFDQTKINKKQKYIVMVNVLYGPKMNDGKGSIAGIVLPNGRVELFEGYDNMKSGNLEIKAKKFAESEGFSNIEFRYAYSYNANDSSNYEIGKTLDFDAKEKTRGYNVQMLYTDDGKNKGACVVAPDGSYFRTPHNKDLDYEASIYYLEDLLHKAGWTNTTIHNPAQNKSRMTHHIFGEKSNSQSSVDRTIDNMNAIKGCGGNLR